MRYLWVFIFIFFSATTAFAGYEAIYDGQGNQFFVYKPPKKKITTYECGNRTTYYVNGNKVGKTVSYRWTSGKLVVHYYDKRGNKISQLEFLSYFI